MSGFSHRIDCLALLKCYEVPGVTIKDIKVDPNSCEVVIVVSTQPAPTQQQQHQAQQIRKRQREGKRVGSRHAKRHSSVGGSMDLVASYSDGSGDGSDADSSAEDYEGEDGDGDMVDDVIAGGRFRRASEREMSQRRIASRAGAGGGRRRYVNSGSSQQQQQTSPSQSEVQEVQRIGTTAATATGSGIVYHRR
jgi:hypothetical protein